MSDPSHEPRGNPEEAVFRLGRGDLPWLALLAAAVLLVFGRSVVFGLTGWDDVVFIARNPALEGPAAECVREILRPGAIEGELLYVPVTYLSFLVEARLLGPDPGVVHGTNVALHLANAVLVWLLLRRLLRRRPLAFLGALAFAVHPLQAESVAWMMGRKELLSALFGLISALAYLRFLCGGRRFYVVALVAFAAGVLAKPGLVVLPALLPILDHRAGLRWTERLAGKVPFLLVSLAAVTVHLSMPHAAPEGLPSLGFRLLCVPWLTWHWAGRLLLLAPPAPLHAWPPESEAATVALEGIPLLLAGAALLLVAVRRGRTGLAQGMLAVALLFLPAAGVVLGYREFVTADRYGYLPLVGIGALAAASPLGLSLRAGRVAVGAVSLWVAASLVLAFPAVSTWRDDLSVWNRMLADDPDQLFALTNRANALAGRGRVAEAVADYERALALSPDGVPILRNLAITHLRAGRPDLAVPVLRKARALAPREPAFPVLLGDAYRELRKPSAAARWYRAALALLPGDAYVKQRLAEALRAERPPGD